MVNACRPLVQRRAGVRFAHGLIFVSIVLLDEAVLLNALVLIMSRLLVLENVIHHGLGEAVDVQPCAVADTVAMRGDIEAI